MRRKKFKKVVAGVGVMSMVLASIVSAGANKGVQLSPYCIEVHADGVEETPSVASDSAIYSKVVTLGADLNDQQRKMILKFFGITDDLDVTVVKVTNQDERKYLEGIIDDDIIGTRTFSCAYILPTNEGGIIVKTANLNWVTGDMIKNALLTSGISNCQVLATAPFEVSGTGALTGVFKAYEESTGESLSEEKKELANEELAVALDLSDNYGEQGTELLNEVKANVLLSESDEITEEEVEEVVVEASESNGVSLSEGDKDKVVTLVYNMSQQEYDTTKLQESLGNYATNIIEEQKGIIDSIIGFFCNIFNAIGDFFSNLFGGSSEEPDTSASPVPSPSVTTESIFDNIDDSEVKLDEEPTGTSSPEVSPEASVLPEETAQIEDTSNVDVTEEPVSEVTEEPVVQQ